MQGVGVLERSTVIVKAVLGIGRGLAIPVVAEGVETDEQLVLLEEYGCDMVQGFYLGHPSPHESITLMLQKVCTMAIPTKSPPTLRAHEAQHIARRPRQQWRWLAGDPVGVPVQEKR